MSYNSDNNNNNDIEQQPISYPPVLFSCELPHNYPIHSIPIVLSIKSQGLSRTNEDLLKEKLAKYMQSQLGNECLYDSIKYLEQKAPSFVVPNSIISKPRSDAYSTANKQRDENEVIYLIYPSNLSNLSSSI